MLRRASYFYPDSKKHSRKSAFLFVRSFLSECSLDDFTGKEFELVAFFELQFAGRFEVKATHVAFEDFFG